LIYQIKVKAHGNVAIMMTLTSPACPVAPIASRGRETENWNLPGVSSVDVKVMWESSWGHPARMSGSGELELGFF